MRTKWCILHFLTGSKSVVFLFRTNTCKTQRATKGPREAKIRWWFVSLTFCQSFSPSYLRELYSNLKRQRLVEALSNNETKLVLINPKSVCLSITGAFGFDLGDALEPGKHLTRSLFHFSFNKWQKNSVCAHKFWSSADCPAATHLSLS